MGNDELILQRLGEIGADVRETRQGQRRIHERIEGIGNAVHEVQTQVVAINGDLKRTKADLSEHIGEAKGTKRAILKRALDIAIAIIVAALLVYLGLR